MSFKRSSLALFLLWVLGQSLVGGDEFPPLKCQQYSVIHGLSQSIVEAIAQDQSGFLWLATEDGLNRFDGYGFKVYRPTPGRLGGLSHNHVTALKAARNGDLWIGTFNGGLNRFNPKTGLFTAHLHQDQDPQSLSSNNIKAISEDSQGQIWVAIEAGGVDVLNITTGRFHHYRHQANNPDSISSDNVQCLLITRQGFIWIGSSDRGLSVLDPISGRAKMIDSIPGKDALSQVVSISALLEDQSGRIWVGTRGQGLYLFSKDGRQLSVFRHDPQNQSSLENDEITALLIDSRQRLWIGTNGGGLHLYQENSESFQNFRHIAGDNFSLSSNEIRSIYEDRGGIIWIGTYGQGVNKFSSHPKPFHNIQAATTDGAGLSNSIVWSIYEDRQHILWVATHGGLDRFDSKKNSWQHFSSALGRPGLFASEKIRIICPDQNDNLWIGTNGGGVSFFESQSGKVRTYRHDPGNPFSLSNDEIRAIQIDRSGMVWIGTYGGGLNRLDPVNGKITRYLHDPANPDSLSNNVIRSILIDSQNQFWLGTHGGGLELFDPARGKFRHFQADPSRSDFLSSNYIFGLLEAQDGKLWIGTWGSGLFLFDPRTGQAQNFTVNEGLPSNAIYNIQMDRQGNLWLSSNNGLCRFSPKTRTFRNYSTSDGLLSNEFNGGAFFHSPNDEMFLGSIEGLTHFFPAQIDDNRLAPPVVLTSFRKLNREEENIKTLGPGIEIELSSQDYFFSFEFSALDFEVPSKNQYAYKMEGLDHEWIQTSAGQRLATYTNMAPGHYTFRVKACNNDGIWNQQGTSIGLKIKPAWWQTLWFRAIILTAFGFLFFIWYHFRTNRFKDILVKENLERELKLKADFTAMLVHDLRSPLTAIIGYAKLLIKQPEKINSGKALSVIINSSEKMVDLINDMLDISKFEAGRVTLQKEPTAPESLIQSTVELLSPLLEAKNLRLKVEISPALAPIILLIDCPKLERVLANLFTNAIKFSPPLGLITISATITDNQLEISISDEGPGIPPEQESQLFNKYAQLQSGNKIPGTGLGLAVSKLIIEAHGGTIGYHPAPNHGSLFFFRLNR